MTTYDVRPQTRSVAVGRAKATTPGKHGDRDWRVSINGIAPTSAEMVFMLGMILIAEDRYPPRRGNLSGRHMLWFFIDLLLTAKTPERVIEIAEDCAAAKRGDVLA